MLLNRCLFICLILMAVSITTLRAQEAAHDHGHEDLPSLGIAKIIPTQGNKVRGILRLVQKGDQLKVIGRIYNLTPGEHGFHIHTFGDQRGGDGKSTGGHYDRHGHDHGAPGAKSHAGDLGNIKANDEGLAEVNVTVEGTALHFILGRAFVIHAAKDDLKSQPSGDAGARVATGVIGIGNPDFVWKKPE